MAARTAPAPSASITSFLRFDVDVDIAVVVAVARSSVSDENSLISGGCRDVLQPFCSRSRLSPARRTCELYTKENETRKKQTNQWTRKKTVLHRNTTSNRFQNNRFSDVAKSRERVLGASRKASSLRESNRFAGILIIRSKNFTCVVVLFAFNNTNWTLVAMGVATSR